MNHSQKELNAALNQINARKQKSIKRQNMIGTGFCGIIIGSAVIAAVCFEGQSVLAFWQITNLLCLPAWHIWCQKKY